MPMIKIEFKRKKKEFWKTFKHCHEFNSFSVLEYYFNEINGELTNEIF